MGEIPDVQHPPAVAVPYLRVRFGVLILIPQANIPNMYMPYWADLRLSI